MPTSHIIFHNSVIENSFVNGRAQCVALGPRIIATHWFRPELVDASNIRLPEHTAIVSVEHAA